MQRYSIAPISSALSAMQFLPVAVDSSVSFVSGGIVAWRWNRGRSLGLMRLQNSGVMGSLVDGTRETNIGADYNGYSFWPGVS